jgi:hypothetical protein
MANAAPRANNESGGKVKGPASYFPSIEKKYGQPIEHWLASPAPRATRRTWRWCAS